MNNILRFKILRSMIIAEKTLEAVSLRRWFEVLRFGCSNTLILASFSGSVNVWRTINLIAWFDNSRSSSPVEVSAFLNVVEDASSFFACSCSLRHWVATTGGGNYDCTKWLEIRPPVQEGSNQAYNIGTSKSLEVHWSLT